MKSFLKYFWSNTKWFQIFLTIFILVFHIGGSIWTGVTWRDVFPMYVIFSAIELTFVVYHTKQWNKLKDDEDTINNTHI